MPKGVPVEVVGYWFPKDGKGPIANDTNTVLRSASNPVLAHLFLNYMLDEPVVAREHQLQRLHAAGHRRSRRELLVKEQILPPSLMSTAVVPSDFRRGVGGAAAASRRRRACGSRPSSS